MHSDPKPLAAVLPMPASPSAPVPGVEVQRELERAAYLSGVEKQLPKHLTSCGVGDIHRDAIALGLETTDALRLARGWWDTGKTFLLLTGAIGCGKTAVACDLFTKLVKPGGYDFIGVVDDWDRRAGLIVQTGELARIGLYGDERELLQRAISRRLLVLDDLGSEFITDPWRSNLFDLINQRWMRGRRTVITTNLGVEALKAKYDGRVVDRIRDNGEAVFCGDKSRRGVQ